VSPVDAGAVGDRLERLRARIEAAGGVEVEILAVTKGFGADAVEAALGAGLTDIGENYVQELEAKIVELEQAGERDVWPRWHVIGQLQRNKVRKVAGAVHLWQSVDRLSVGAEIARRAPGAAVLVQVNITDEPQKAGCRPAFAAGLVEGLVDLGLDVRGLMGVGPAGPAEGARGPFRELTRLADELGLPERSMGMSGDLEVAVQEGATMVRIGTALFGPRFRPAAAGH
jgi:pyridoxal phosphate enzyme (YggS family)